MCVVIPVFSLSFTSQAMTECGKPSDEDWWKTAATGGLGAGANVIAEETGGWKP